MALTAGVIGLGRVGAQWDRRDALRAKPATHLSAWVAIPEVSKVFVADADESKTREVLDWNLPKVFPSGVATIGAEACDIVSVATPSPTHFSVVMSLLDQERPPRLIFCEKPIATSLDDARRMIDACASKHVKLAVNHSRRWDAVWRKAARMVSEEVTDAPNMAVAHFTGDPVNVGVHMADLINWFNIEGVCEAFGHRDAEYLLFELDVFFPRKRVRVFDNGLTVDLYVSKESSRYAGIKELSLVSTSHNEGPTAMYNACSQLVRVLNEGESPQCVGEDGLKALERVLEWEKRAR